MELPIEHLGKFNINMSSRTTLMRHLYSEEIGQPGARGHCTTILLVLKSAVKILADTINRMVLNGELIDREDYMEVERYASDLFTNMLMSSRKVLALSSYSEKEILIVDKEKRGEYSVVFSALDGESFRRCSMGETTFAIYRKGDESKLSEVALQPGREAIAAGYAIYSVSTVLVLSLGRNKGVCSFLLSNETGEFLLMKSSVEIPKTGKLLSFNSSSFEKLDPETIGYIRWRKKFKWNPYTFHYSGSIVADVHRVLIDGGICISPALNGAPRGTIDLVHKGIPLSIIIEEAGGISSTAKQSILQIVPEYKNQNQGIYLGSEHDVQQLLDFLVTCKSQNINNPVLPE